VNDPFLAMLSAVGPFAVMGLLVIIGLLSQRLGAVTKMPPHYRWCFVAAGVVGASALARLVAATIAGREARAAVALLYPVMLALGVTMGVVVAWRYWSWLFGERGR
jgi:hypothetical protein